MKRNIFIIVIAILLIGTFTFIMKKSITKDKTIKPQEQQVKEIKNKEDTITQSSPKVLSEHNRIETIYDDGTKILQEVLPSKTDTSLHTFHDRRWNTSVDFSKKLSYEIDSIVDSPDSGIRIFLDNDDKKDKYAREYILVYGCVGHLYVQVYNNTKKEHFITKQNVQGYLYITENKLKQGYTEVELILGDGFIGARGFYKNENREKKEKEILIILKNIQLYNESDKDFRPELYSEDKLKN